MSGERRLSHTGFEMTRSGLVVVLLAGLLLLGVPPRPAHADHKSDQNSDGVIDLEDVILFSDNVLGEDWKTVDWCSWASQPEKHGKHLESLIDFVGWYFQCDQAPGDPLAILNSNDSPTRLVWSPDGQRLYVTDSQVGSVFIYDSALTLFAELKRAGKPLGIATDSLGNFYVGSDEQNEVEVYDRDGLKTASIGAGSIQMPNDLTLGPDGNLYVVDSRSDRVVVFEPTLGTFLRTIGEGLFRFPVALAIRGEELFVADQGNFSVKVFDLQGTLLRSFGSKSSGFFRYKWEGRFVRLQSLAFDGLGRVHALDSHMGVIQVLDPVDGTFITSYAQQGKGPAQLELPLDLDINAFGEVAVTNNGNRRIEMFKLATPP
jgi:DNA-binding beta-propeller fold protein YncE